MQGLAFYMHPAFMFALNIFYPYFLKIMTYYSGSSSQERKVFCISVAYEVFVFFYICGLQVEPHSLIASFPPQQLLSFHEIMAKNKWLNLGNHICIHSVSLTLHLSMCLISAAWCSVILLHIASNQIHTFHVHHYWAWLWFTASLASPQNFL